MDAPRTALVASSAWPFSGEAAFCGASTALEEYHPTTAEEVSKYERETLERLAQHFKV